MSNNSPSFVVTNEVRLSYCHLHRPYMNPSAGMEAKPKYSVTILLPKTDVDTKRRIDAAIEAAAQDGVRRGKFDQSIPLDKLPHPIYDGDGFRADGYTPFGPECKGHWVFTASNTDKPEVVDSNGNPIINSTEIYSGMRAKVSMTFFPYSIPGRKGVGCSLGNVLKTRDDEPLGGGRTSAASDFGFTAPQQAQTYQPQPAAQGYAPAPQQAQTYQPQPGMPW